MYICGNHKLGWYKIGASKQIERRVKSLEVPFTVELIKTWPMSPKIMRRVEQRTLHTRFSPKRIRGEWFALTEEDLTLIATLQITSMADCIEDTKRRDWELIHGDYQLLTTEELRRKP